VKDEVDPAVVRQLLSLNRQFYESFAQPFSQTRLRLQPGVRKLLPRLVNCASLLDFGCGNGELLAALLQAGFHGRYVGLDFSRSLLQIAAQRWAEEGGQRQASVSFQAVEITQPDWHRSLSGAPFNAVVAFAVLHHLPSFELRLQVLKTLRQLLAADAAAALYLSNWQFLNSPRFRQRIQPWDEVGLSETALEAGDTLLDWRQGGRGLRYVHHFSEEELAQLAQQSGFAVVESFSSDGRGGNLAIYQVWKSQPGGESESA